MKNILLGLSFMIAASSCGDNLKLTDAGHPDGNNKIPAVPTLGAQMDRLGRPAINTALNHAFDGTTAAGAAKDAYNQDGSPGGWSTYAASFAASAGFIDVLDTGLTCNPLTGTCVANAGAANGAGCGNQALYNGNLLGGGAPTATSYGMLATILSDDELYLDTSKTSCELPGNAHANYLGVEFNVLASLPNTCGGRAPTNDVMDVSYTVLATGVAGFNVNDFTPAIGDGVGPHADVSNDTFPFFGTPH
jgi:hypothetical protein